MATSITKRYWVDLTDMRITTSLGDRTNISAFVLKARDSSKIGFQFHLSGVPVLLSAGSTIIFGIKDSGDYGGDYLASVSSFTAATTTNSSTTDIADTDFYYGTLDLNTTEITTALGDVTDSTAAIAELQVDIGGSGERISSPTYVCTIQNDVNRGGEGTPTSGSPPWPTDVSELIRYKKGITSLTGGTSADLDGIVTTSITVPLAVGIANSDGGETWETWVLESGTDAEDSANGIVRPDDYATTTNEKVWYRKAVFPSVDDDNVSAAASATNYTPAASTAAGHFSGIDTALGTLSDWVIDTTPQAGGDVDFNGFNAQFDDATGIEDDAGNELITFSKTASAVNKITVANAATGSGPALSATGDDTDIDLNLAGKGTGVPKIGGSAIVTANDSTFAKLAGKSGSQVLYGGTAAAESLTLGSTAHATKGGGVLIPTGDFFEVGNMTAPSSPSVDRVRIYSTANVLYAKDTNGTVSALAGASSYKNIFLAPEFFGNYSTTSASLATVALGVTGTFGKYQKCWAFDDTTAEGIDLSFPVPHDMVVADDLKMKLVWSQSHSNSGNVVWSIYTWYTGFGADASTYPTSGLSNTETVIDAGGSLYRINKTPAQTIVDGGNLTVGNLFHMRISREAASGSDTMTGDALLLYAEMQYSAKHSSTSW